MQSTSRLACLSALALTLGIGSAQAQTTLTVWSDTERLTSFAAYDEAHDDVTLDVVTVAPEELVAKLQLALRAGGDTPDAIFMADINYGAMLSTRRSDYMLDLTQYVPAETLDSFYPNANAPCLVNGKLVCLRNDIAQNVIWYDKAVLDGLGKTVPATWEEFEALGAELGPQGYVLGSATMPVPLVSILMADNCALAVPVEGQPDTISINLDSEACRRPAALIDTMIANGSLSKETPFAPAFVSLAKEGKLALTVGPTWFGEFVMKPTYEMAAGTLGAALPPKWSDQDQPLTWSWGGGAYGGWKDSANPQAVADMILWLTTSDDNQRNAVTMPAYRPAAATWGTALTDDGYYANDDIFSVMETSATYAHPGYASLRFLVTDAVSKIVVPAINNGGKLVDVLPALQEEVTNSAKVAGYTVVQ